MVALDQCCLAYLFKLFSILKKANYCPNGFVDSVEQSGEIKPWEWRRTIGQDHGCFRNLSNVLGSQPTKEAYDIREGKKEYLNSVDG